MRNDDDDDDIRKQYKVDIECHRAGHKYNAVLKYILQCSLISHVYG